MKKTGASPFFSFANFIYRISIDITPRLDGMFMDKSNDF